MKETKNTTGALIANSDKSFTIVTGNWVASLWSQQQWVWYNCLVSRWDEDNIFMRKYTGMWYFISQSTVEQK